ncbi:MAG: FtsX-like permease family protein [Bacillota bacterium]|nr:FtsX-like permease family protein [Bacillota bacterium]MDW7685259.1 FtsX-like permease family protein [Bacillota bacterium]
MKQNVTINSIAIGNIRGRRRQYSLLIIGIVLAIYFVATTLLFASTMFTSLRERHYHRFGEQDAIMFNSKDAPLDELILTGIFSEYGIAKIHGYVLPDGKSQNHGFSVAVFDDSALALARKDTIEGRLPEKAGEIALEQSTLARLRTGAVVDDTITLTLLVPDGRGFMDLPVQKEYTLVGVLNDKLIHLERRGPSAPAYNDYPAGVLFAEEQITAGGKEIINVYGRYAQDARTSFDRLTSFMKEHGIMNDYGWAAINTGFSFFGSVNDGTDSILATSLFFIVIALVLVLAACLGIINAFSANLESRKRQIGLLRAVGATRKQIRDVFGRETLILAVISIPLGLLLALLTVWGITEVMGPSYIFRPNVLIILAVAAAGVLCVMLAASIPLRKAAKIPPMQAIRDVDLARKVKRSKVKSKDFFDVPRLIAQRNLTLYKNRQLSITAMLVVSIVLMSLLALAAKPLLSPVSWHFDWDYTLYQQGKMIDWLMEFDYYSPGITEQDKADIAALAGVKSVTGYKNMSIKILTDKITPYMLAHDSWRFEYLSPEPHPSDHPDMQRGREMAHKSYLESKAKYGYEQDYLTVDFTGIDAEVVERLSPFVSAGRIDLEKLAAGEEVLVIAPAEYGIYEMESGDDTWFNADFKLNSNIEYTNVYQNDMFKVGDPLTVSLLYSEGPLDHPDGPRMYNYDGSRLLPDDVTREDRKVTIGAILELSAGEKNLYSYFFNSHPEVGNLVTTTAGLQALGFNRPYHSLHITLYESPDSEMEEYLDANLAHIAARTRGVDVRSNIALARENRDMGYGLLIAAGTVVILFFAICVSMVNNALSARIRAGKREIGAIRAVGASEREILHSYLWQLVSMFAWGTGIGMTIQLALARWLLIKDKQVVTIATIPLWQPLMFVAILFGICYLNVRMKVTGILKDSIVENIREL